MTKRFFAILALIIFCSDKSHFFESKYAIRAGSSLGGWGREDFVKLCQ